MPLYTFSSSTRRPRDLVHATEAVDAALNVALRRLARARVNDAYGQEFTPKNSHRKSLAFRKDCLS